MRGRRYFTKRAHLQNTKLGSSVTSDHYHGATVAHSARTEARPHEHRGCWISKGYFCSSTRAIAGPAAAAARVAVAAASRAFPVYENPSIAVMIDTTLAPGDTNRNM